MFESVGVQVVTYHNEPAQLVRLAEAIAATAVAARSAGVRRVTVHFGDCSDTPCLRPVEADLRNELAAAADEVDIVEFGENLGSGGGSNALAARHSSDVIWVLNPDTYPSPGSAVELLTALSKDGVAVAEGRQVPIEHPKEYDLTSGDTSWASGCCFMVRREAFDAHQGFDAHYFPMYCDDVDLSWRLRHAGWRVVHVPTAVVFHDKRISSQGGVQTSDFERRSGTLARLWLTRRYDRPDLEAETLAWIDTEGAQAHRDAAAEFHRRVSLGDAPAVMADAGKTAQFVDGDYARHRFRHTG